MDIMLILQFIVLLGGIYLGVKLGGMGIGYAGGVGVIVLTLVLGMKTEMKHIGYLCDFRYASCWWT